MTKPKDNLNDALKDSLQTLTKAWQDWDDIELEQDKKRPYGSMEDRMKGEAKTLLRDLKTKLDSFS